MKIQLNFFSYIKPPSKLKVSQWAVENKYLSAESSAEPGKWNIDRAPYQVKIMDAINDPDIDTIVIMSSSQVGKTEIILTFLGYFMDYDPSPILIIQPTLDMARTFSKRRLAPMLRDTPALKGKVGEVRSKDGDNTIYEKSFPGGYLAIVGANSAAGLASRPIRILLADEVDRYPESAGAEGDPLELGNKRTVTFWNRKKIYFSTPTIKGVSRIESAFDEGTKEFWNLPCPSCGKFQPLTWGQIRFENVTHECRYCKTQHTKLEWLKGKGKWVAENNNPLNPKCRSFHLSELLSPWKDWDEVIADFKAAKAAGPERLKVWTNTSLGETWEEEGEELETEYLERRREHYETELPDGILYLTAGADIQKDRIEVEVVGWGVGKESWGVEYKLLMGDTNKPEVWNQLDDFLQRTWHYSDGSGALISGVCIDSGYKATAVYKFCKPREVKRIFAIKGKGGSGVPFINRPTRNNRQKAALFSIGVDDAKETLFLRLKQEFPGAGYCHFPREANKGYGEGYFKELTSERKVIRYKLGKPYFVWEKRKGSKVRNEPLDVRIYATAALEILNPNLDGVVKNKIAVSAVQQQAQKKPRKRMISRGISV